tara:strand:- start:1996 stop:2526 length:531 start_codon:yes stop_codon:yes gene_type:complete
MNPVAVEDEIVVKEFWYESKLYYIDEDEDNIYDATNLRKIGTILSGSVFIVDERLVKASDEKIECYIKARDKWTSYAMNPKYDKALYHAFGIRALICETTIKMGQIEKLIYKSIINGKQDLNLKYKEKYLSHIQQALEYWGTLNEMGAEDEGKYLMVSNKLKEDYDFVDTLTKAFV